MAGGRSERGPHGLLLLDKPAGPTSHAVVEAVRRLTGGPRAGHTGTLDPMATGLLPVVLGRATRLARFLPDSPKVYEGRLRLGLTTSTDDIAGEVRHVHQGPPPPADAVLREARRLTGRILQVPPAVSARKVAGERLYRLAWRGQTVVAPATEVEVVRFDLEPVEDPAEWRFRVEVSAGTYVRALARDLGAALGVGGALTALRRVSIGPLDLAAAVALPEAGPGPARDLLAAVIPLESMPLVPPPVSLPDVEAGERFLAGREARLPEGTPPRDGECRVLDPRGILLGIGERSGAVVRPRVVLLPPGRGRPSLAPREDAVLSSRVEKTKKGKGESGESTRSGPPADDGGSGGG